ncbi:MAG: capsular polysaccharide biosynthesis protein [Pseudomonadota bacterium]
MPGSGRIDRTGAPKRLGVWSLGFLRQPLLRRALADAGWQVRPGYEGVDAVGVWGRTGVSWRGQMAAVRTRRPLITLEDGFIRSVRPGAGQPVLSLIADDIGIYYDARSPSLLEQMINEGGGDVERSERAMATLRQRGLSKYNDAPRLDNPPRGHVLVIDQTANDASIAGGLASRDSFARMLRAAEAEHPGTDIIIRCHPEVLAGRKAGHLDRLRLGPNTRIWPGAANPWDMITDAKAVYTVTSQLGFEALMAGIPVRCFGMPFYAGWGATSDAVPAPDRREAQRNVPEIFATAFLDYPLYFDPWRGGMTNFETALDALTVMRDHAEANRQPSIAVGVRLWKRAYVAGFLTGAVGPPVFDDDPSRAGRRAVAEGRRVVFWAGKATEPAAQRAAAGGAPIARIEDGFLRSAGLGAALVPPLSLALDDEGIYYDPTRPSRMERLIAAAPMDEASLARAAALRRQLIDLKVTKYNLPGRKAVPELPADRRVILVPGQVEDDASIRLGAGETRRNLALLQTVRETVPDAFIIYKPHPDVEAGLRPGHIESAGMASLADHVAENVSAADMLQVVDEVWTITSLIGFEALLRDLPVTCLGVPFYAGWGLTDDRGAVPARRRARPSLDQLVHAVLIDYPMYRDPVSDLPCTPEVIVGCLADGAGASRAPMRALSKLQGLFASFAPLWR